MIDEYNAGSVNVEEFFKKLVNFAQGLKRGGEKRTQGKSYRGRIGALRSPDEAGYETDKEPGAGSQEGGQGTPGKPEERKVGAGLAEAAADKGDGSAVHRTGFRRASRSFHGRSLEKEMRSRLPAYL